MRNLKGVLALAAAGVLMPLPGHAVLFDFELFDTRVDGVLNNSATFGYSFRLQDQASDLVGKANLNPDVCADQFQSCQGLHREQTFPAERLASAPGAPSINFDDGNLNYDRGDVTQAPFKLTQDIRLLFGNYGFFARAIGIYDYHNYHSFKTTVPNLITEENFDRVGQRGNLGGQPVLRTGIRPRRVHAGPAQRGRSPGTWAAVRHSRFQLFRQRADQ